MANPTINDHSPIERKHSSAMRGIAIIAIFLHNYCHWLPMVQENEYTYTQHNADLIWSKILNPRADILAQLFSFFGHYGVQVFVFLSAYGLVMKYEKSPAGKSDGGAIHFLWSHYKKLFLMMIVGYVAFVMVDYMTPRPRHYVFWNVVGQLGMFSNLYDDPDHNIWPGPYWYFGLMVQIYIAYRIILYKGKGSLGGMLSETGYNIMLMVLFVATLAGQLAFDPMGESLEWYRYNIMGALPTFIFGMWYARSPVSVALPRWGYAVATALMTVVIAVGSLSFQSWILLPFAICLATISLVKCLPSFILNPLVWVGGISAAMFVCHPITRKVLIPISRHGDLYAGMLLYFCATIIIAILFQRIIAIISKKQ